MSAPFYVSYVGLWALVVFQSMVVIGLVRALHDKRLVEADPPRRATEDLTGEPLPEFTGEDVFGAQVTSASLVGERMALLFVSPDCQTCAVTLQELDALRRRMSGRVVVFCRSEQDRCTSMAHHYNLSVPVIIDGDRKIADLLHVGATPTAVTITTDGRIESYGHPMSPEDLQRQIEEARGNGRLPARGTDRALAEVEP